MSRFPLRQELQAFLTRARRVPLRSMERFAEEEIVIPSGPFAGRRFRCDRQPYTRLWFQSVDSGRWNRFVATGPTQSGKSLAAFVIPTLWHLFEAGETVICGVPDLAMAGDKWRQDLLPVIERSRFREWLPIHGSGSRGGQVSAIQFANGATLRFMSGGGGDKARAGFTSRVLVVTETDGMDEPGTTSRESDKVTQLEARTRAYGANKRVYLECTVSTEEGRTWQEYTAGTRSRIALPCPHCRLSVSPEREHFVGWQEAASVLEARHAGTFQCPECRRPWSEAERIAANQRAALVHDGESIDGGVVTGEPKQTDTLGFRWSAVHNLFVTAADLAADEWRAARRDEEDAEKEMRQFVWCLPVAANRWAETTLAADQIMRRTAAWPRGIAPEDTIAVTAAIDLGKYLAHWVIAAWRPNGCGHVVDYGRIEVPTDDLGLDQALLVALREFRELIRGGCRVAGSEKTAAPKTVWIDAGYMPEVVYRFCREAKQPFGPSLGRGVGQQGRSGYRRPSRTGSIVQRVGEGFHLVLMPEQQMVVAEVDADYWKTRIANRMACPVEAAGAITLFASPPAEHLAFAKHLTAERRIEEFLAGRGVVTRWERVHRANHFFDAIYNAAAAASFLGVRGEPERGARPQPLEPAEDLEEEFAAR